MKVGSPADNASPVAPVSTGRTGTGDTPVKGSAAAGPAAEASAQVALSSTASSMLSGSSAEFDAEKVERISKAIASGTFKVNHEVIADKLIANAQELLNRSAR